MASTRPAMPQRVLWVEDEPETIDGTRRLLQLEGHTVIVEPNFGSASPSILP
jgi:CheY-like chemotaxis protein